MSRFLVNMKKIPLLFIIAVAIISCTNTSKYSGIMISGFDKNVSTENAPLSVFVDSIEVVPLACNNATDILTNPEKVVCYNNKFYVLDNNRLLCYAASGKFMRSIGERGNGHGEYINMATFVVYNDTIRVLDSFKNRLLAYTLDGKFLYEQEAPEGCLSNVSDAEFEHDDLLFMANYIYNSQNTLYTRWNIVTDEVSIIKKALVQTNGTREFVGRHAFCMHNGNIRYVLPFADIVNSTKNEAIRFQTAKKVLTNSELENMDDFGIMAYANHMKDFVGFCDIFEMDNYLLLTFFDAEYIVVDKKDYTCFRYNYKYNEDAEAFPLLKILSSSGNTLIGIVDMEQYENLKTKAQRYVTNQGTIGNNYAIILYHVK